MIEAVLWWALGTVATVLLAEATRRNAPKAYRRIKEKVTDDSEPSLAIYGANRRK